MAQAGYTPISLYYSTTAAAVPTSGNLASGELAINITDGKLYYKNNSGVVTLLAGATSGPAGGSNTQVQFNSSGVLAGSANLTFNGTTLTANTIGAFTLGGTIAGGGNQINNVIIGTTTPLAGAFTTLSASGRFDESADIRFMNEGFGIVNANNSARIMTFNNTSITTNVGIAVTGTGSYTGLLYLGGSTGTLAERLQVNRGTDDATQSSFLGYTSLTMERTGVALSSVGTFNFNVRGITTVTPLSFDYAGVAVTGTFSASGAITNTAGTANGVTYLNGSKVLTSGSALTFDGTKLNVIGSASNQVNFSVTATSSDLFRVQPQASGTGVYLQTTDYAQTVYAPMGFYATAFTFNADATIYGVTVGRGAGAVASNTAVGASALSANTSGTFNTAVGLSALAGNLGGAYNTAVGRTALTANTSGTENTGLGTNALQSNQSGNFNTAVGVYSLVTNVSGSYNTAIGDGSLWYNTASSNTAVGYRAGYTNAGGSDLVAIGFQAAYSTQADAGNMAVGMNALYTNNGGVGNTAIGTQHSGVSNAALYANTTGSYNTVVGTSAMRTNVSGSSNTAVGYQAGFLNNNGLNNAFFGHTAGYTNSSGQYCTYIGRAAGFLSTGNANTFVGTVAGYNSTGNGNTFVGSNTSTYYGAGFSMTTGSGNTILGGFSGISGSLDIRTATNYIVLSDGAGNPRQIVDYLGTTGFGVAPSPWFTQRRAIQFGSTGSISAGTSYYPYAVYYGNNFYYDNTDTPKYLESSGASFIAPNAHINGNVEMYCADAGTAGNTASFALVFGVGKGTTIALEGASRQSGTGITFPATQSASSNANTLDDYEEGTWTPTIIAAGGSGSPTYSSNIGIYTKIGNTVIATAFIAFTKNTMSGGVLQSGGFPFTTNAGGYYQQSACYITAGSLITNPICQVGTNSTALDVLKSNVVTGAVTSTLISDLGTGSLELRYTITYQV